MRLRLSSDSSFLLSTYVFAMAAAANLYFYFWYQQLKLIYVAFLRQDHRAKCETISLFPLTTNNSIAEKGFLSSVSKNMFSFSKWVSKWAFIFKMCFRFQEVFFIIFFHFQKLKGFVSVAYLKWGHYLHLPWQLVKSPYCKVVTCWWKHCQHCLKNHNNTKNVKQLGNCVFNCDTIKLILL